MKPTNDAHHQINRYTRKQGIQECIKGSGGDDKYTSKQLLPPKVKIDRRKLPIWGSSHYTWQPLLEQGYRNYFEHSCNQYSHYLDSFREYLEGDPTLKNTTEHCIRCYTALDTDMYQLVGYYIYEDNIGITFDSGCTTTITTYTSDFDSTIIPVQKKITRLGSTSEVLGEGTVK